MIICYALIAAFMFGIYIGAAYERDEKPELSEVFPLVVWSVLWPIVLGFLLYVEIRRRSR